MASLYGNMYFILHIYVYGSFNGSQWCCRGISLTSILQWLPNRCEALLTSRNSVCYPTCGANGLGCVWSHPWLTDVLGK